MTERFIDLYIKPCPMTKKTPILSMHIEDYQHWTKTWSWYIYSSGIHWFKRSVYINIRNRQKENPSIIVNKLINLVERWNEGLILPAYEVKRITFEDIEAICEKQKKRRLDSEYMREKLRRL